MFPTKRRDLSRCRAARAHAGSAPAAATQETDTAVPPHVRAVNSRHYNRHFSPGKTRGENGKTRIHGGHPPALSTPSNRQRVAQTWGGTHCRKTNRPPTRFRAPPSPPVNHLLHRLDHHRCATKHSTFSRVTFDSTKTSSLQGYGGTGASDTTAVVVVGPAWFQILPSIAATATDTHK